MEIKSNTAIGESYASDLNAAAARLSMPATPLNGNSDMTVENGYRRSSTGLGELLVSVQGVIRADARAVREAVALLNKADGVAASSLKR
ncbi:MAG: hypothetical protein LBP28_06515 [Coriobacteriales bacterium]|jgi:hypothetical protein|nr:hypothetical protein [Coriobacteriales bacterium]